MSPPQFFFWWFWGLLAIMVPSGSQRVGKGCILVLKDIKKLQNMRPGEVEKQLSGVLWWRVLHSLVWKSFSVEDVFSLILNHISGVFCHLSRFAVPFVAKARGENLRWATSTQGQKTPKFQASKTHVKSSSRKSLQAVFEPLVARCALGTLP